MGEFAWQQAINVSFCPRIHGYVVLPRMTLPNAAAPRRIFTLGRIDRASTWLAIIGLGKSRVAYCQSWLWQWYCLAMPRGVVFCVWGEDGVSMYAHLIVPCVARIWIWLLLFGNRPPIRLLVKRGRPSRPKRRGDSKRLAAKSNV
jgi:hypothetical protein